VGWFHTFIFLTLIHIKQYELKDKFNKQKQWKL